MKPWGRLAIPWIYTSLLLGCSKPGYESKPTPAASEGGTQMEEERDPPQGAGKGDADPEHAGGPPRPASPGDTVIENTQPEKNLANQPGYEYAPGKGPSAPPPRDAGPDAETGADTDDDD